MKYETLKKIFFQFDPENAHSLAMKGLRFANNNPWILNVVGRNYLQNDEILKQNLWGINFDNPIGLAGGFDKDGVALKALQSLGFGHIEFGTVTPKPQPGNEKPRLFRLVKNESIQNAMGFNNAGMEVVKKNVSKFYPLNSVIVANIGKNKITPNDEALNDYEILVKEFDEVCDMFVVNLSSPNTPNLRDLQESEYIKRFFETLKPLTKKPILLKISPDFAYDQAIEICTTAVENRADGIIINNTSIDYSLSPNIKEHKGGISGKLITHKSRELLKAISKELFGKTTLISCGGIDSAEEAYERIKYGASLIQIYTSFIFKGPTIAKDINEGLIKLLKKDGFSNIKEAIGIEIKK